MNNSKFMRSFFAIFFITIGFFSLSRTGLAETVTATLKVVVNVNNTNGGTNTPSDFIISVVGASAIPANFNGNSLGTNVTVAANQAYKVSVASLSYDAVLSPDCSNSLPGGGEATCTITLSDLPKLNSGQNPPNLIQNSSVEAVNGNLPNSWVQAGFGTNDRTFSYPVDGVGGGSALKVSITNYTDGDAKWYFTEVPVTAMHPYVFTDNYISSVNSLLSAEYFDSNHNHLSYGGFFAVAPSPSSPQNSWGEAQATFVPPTGAKYMTVFHLINSVGTLTTDNFSLTEVPLPTPFSKGFVSLTFDDGFTSQWTNALPKLISANMKATFYVASHVISGLSINNASLENAASNKPVGWDSSGSADSVFTYPTEGHTGDGAMVSSDKNNSNAAWSFTPISVLSDSIYTFSEWYKSNTDSELVALVTKNDGSIIQADVTDASGNTVGNSVTLPTTNDEWKEVNPFFYIPVDAKNVTVLNRLKGIGNLVIDDVSMGTKNYMNSTQVKSLIDSGQEVGGHSQSHRDLTTLSEGDVQAEVSNGRQDLLLNGISPVISFDYPYGIFNQTIKNIVQSSGYTSGRSVMPGFNGKETEKFSLYAQSVNRDTTLSTVTSWINQSVNDHTWLILVFHDIDNELNQTPYGTTPSNLQLIIDYLKNNNVPVYTVSEGINLMANDIPPAPLPTLVSIEISKPATKLSYLVGEPLDISGLEVTGKYDDNSTKKEDITISNISGFNSTSPVNGQVITITVNGKTTTYTIDITQNGGNNGGGGGGGDDGKDDNKDKDKGDKVHRGHGFPIFTKERANIEKKIGKVLGAEKFKFNVNLRYKMNNQSVKELQKILKKKGIYSGPITGYFGPLTLKIIKKYQEDNGLPSTGYVGDLTRKILNDEA